MEVLRVAFLMQMPFLLQLLAGEAMFSLRYRRRRHFVLRCVTVVLGVLFLCLPVCLLTARSANWVISNFLCYLLLFLITLIGLSICYEENAWSIVLCGVSGYTAQHLTAQICLILWGGERFAAFFGPGGGVKMIRFRVTETLLYVAVYAIIYFCFARRANAAAPSDLLGRNVFQLSVITLALMIALSSVRDYYAGESAALTVITRLFSIFCCLFLLMLRSGILEKSVLEREMDTIRRLRSKERSQYELSRENIALINLKCHDLKRQIEIYERRGGALTATELGEIKAAVAIYDTVVRTDNETLDTLLTERSLYCEKHGIRLACIADGAILDFLSPGDLCSLFGNALDNAIEAVSRLEREEERIISMAVRMCKGMLSITVDNAYEGKLTFVDGLPITTKSDRRYHGFGLKSIRLVTEKYGGEMTVSADELFHLGILLPLPA